MGYVSIKGFVWHVYTISNTPCNNLAKENLENPPTRPAPIAISENHLKNAAMRRVRCHGRVDHFSTGWTIKKIHRA